MGKLKLHTRVIYLDSQDTFYVGNFKGFGCIYQHGIYSKMLYTTKTPITSADLLNDSVLPFFEEKGMGILRMLTHRSIEYCVKPDHHD